MTAVALRSRQHLIAWALLLLAFGVRLAFLHATVDRIWPYSCYFKGDALTFIQQASSGELLESGAPFRPPGVALILAMVWDQTAEGFLWLRHFWMFLGALPAPLLYLLCRSRLDERVALLASSLLAVASGPMVLGSALGSETPYLVLSVISLGWLVRLGGPAHWLQFAAFGALQAAGCLLRAEHVLFLPLALVWVLRSQKRHHSGSGVWLCAAAALLAFGLALLPWHRYAWGAIDKLNSQEQQRVLYSIPWSDTAKQRLQSLPAFAQFGTLRMLEDTVQVRGRRKVEVDDFAILEEAYDYIPEPLSPYPFLTLYGPLNFYLANHPDCMGGFSRAPLFAKPPLRGGLAAYPAGLDQALPKQLALSYPPHLRIVNEGYELGIENILGSPGSWLGIVFEKLSRFWAGAASGLGGYALPIGMSGIRYRVDVVTAVGWWAWTWRVLVLGVCAFGVLTYWRRSEVQPWLLWIALRVVLVVLFFGYARHGILIAPSVAILVALTLDRFWSRTLAGFIIGVLCLIPLLEVYRYIDKPSLTQDGSEIQGRDPSAHEYQDRRIQVR
jgi:hypothetical protein